MSETARGAGGQAFDPGGIAAISLWLSEATPPRFEAVIDDIVDSGRGRGAE